MVKARICEMGNFETLSMNGTVHSANKYEKAMILEFDSAEDLRAALEKGACEFSFLGSDVLVINEEDYL